MSELRQRKGAATARAPSAVAKEEARSVTINKREGYLGVTLSNTPSGVGVLVEEAVAADLIAAAGLKAGDVILRLNGREVNRHGDAIEILNSAPDVGLQIEYWTEAQAAKATPKPAPSKGVQALKWVFFLLVFVGVPAMVFYARDSGLDFLNPASAAKPASAAAKEPARSAAKAAKPAAVTKERARAMPAPAASGPGTFGTVMQGGEEINLMEGSFDDVEEVIDRMTDAEVVAALQKADPKWKPDPEKHTATPESQHDTNDYL